MTGAREDDDEDATGEGGGGADDDEDEYECAGSPAAPAWSRKESSLTFVTVSSDEPVADDTAQVWYVPNFLDEREMAIVREGCAKLRKKFKRDHSFAVGRLSAMVPMTNPAYGVFAGDDVVSKLRDIAGAAQLACGDYPVEARVYRPGASMPWFGETRPRPRSRLSNNE